MRFRLLVAAAALIAVVFTAEALAATLSTSRAQRAAQAAIQRAQNTEPGATSSQRKRCLRRSRTRVDCGYSISGFLTGNEACPGGTEFTIRGTARVTLTRSGRVRVALVGARRSEACRPGGAEPPPASGFNPTFRIGCSPEQVPPCRQIVILGAFDGTPRGVQIDAVRFVILPQDGFQREILEATCPSQLSGRVPESSSQFQCRVGDTRTAPSIGSSEVIKLFATFNVQAQPGTTVQLFARPVGGDFQGPVTLTLPSTPRDFDPSA